MRNLSEKNYAELSAGIEKGTPVDKIMLTPPKTRFKNNNEESRMQRYLVRWWSINCKRWGLPDIALFSIPNGGNWDARRGSIMKAEGQKKGVPDLMLAASATKLRRDEQDRESDETWFETYHALFLELKTETGRLSPEQVAYHAFLAKQCYLVRVCRSTEEAIREIEKYLT